MGLTNLPVELTFPIAWGQMDAFEHVNNVVYFRYFEDARITYFRELGMLEEMESCGQGPILASTQCRFILPLKYPDEVTVGASVRELGADRFSMQYRVFSHKQQAVAAEGTGRIVYFDYKNNKKAALPAHIVKRIHELEDGRAEESLAGRTK
ncbi:MAG: acyl-CoA thioesterase [Deltaproteobacteria bacterium]|jgi:acyl-CoA thioester hydrolase|nr:acyl-CoA thioesterase [Deltaproteobacteria bacterium]MBT6434397.1 acyl-CoA thioesterase [Deltaproteobacteria bacterium]MBT6489729.1 acyl-CoA thioesterase [Deltaproteobacteria bacterium]